MRLTPKPTLPAAEVGDYAAEDDVVVTVETDKVYISHLFLSIPNVSPA
jgi:hypothetical protein